MCIRDSILVDTLTDMEVDKVVDRAVDMACSMVEVYSRVVSACSRRVQAWEVSHNTGWCSTGLNSSASCSKDLYR